MANERICAVGGCGKAHSAKGYCAHHYMKLWRHGDPNAGRPAREITRYAPVCSVDGCSRPHKSLGYCAKHHWRFATYGDPLGGGPERATASGEPYRWLLGHVGHSGDDCLIWPFSCANKGYGFLQVRGRKVVASRLMCELAHGLPPTTKHQAAHSCGNGYGGCVNPNHLRWATQSENQKDREAHGTSKRGKKGTPHKLTEDDVIEIRRLKSTMSLSQIGKKFGISKTTVSSICRRRSWSWMKD